MSEARSGNTHEVIVELFRAMDTPIKDRDEAGLPRWADAFPWVNGGLFDGAKEVPRFSRIARSYLLHAGRLDWQKINPDIFGSMIQAMAEDEERGELGLHYTSVPNILKVLNPLFLDDLREQLEKAGENSRKLLNLRKRIARIRVFDPACGSGNFLVIAYLRMREIEAGNTAATGRGAQALMDTAGEFPRHRDKGFRLRDRAVVTLDCRIPVRRTVDRPEGGQRTSAASEGDRPDPLRQCLAYGLVENLPARKVNDGGA